MIDRFGQTIAKIVKNVVNIVLVIQISTGLLQNTDGCSFGKCSRNTHCISREVQCYEFDFQKATTYFHVCTLLS